MLSSLGCLLLCGSIALALGNAQKLPKGKKPSLKVHINTTSDSILLKFLRPNANVKLEGFLLGYGSNVSPNQYFPLPTEGKFTEAVVDAEPKYLIVVRPAPPPSQKKSCSGKSRPRKPLQLVVGTLTPSSVFLSWGFLINPHHDWTLPSHCPSDRFYTIRYREKDKEKKWIFQLCPATETIVENLKPNTVYEFGVKDNIEGGIWSKIFNHKTIVGSKNKVNGKIQSTYDQVHSVPVPRKLIPLTIIKQVIQNVTHRASTKSPDKTPFGGTILVHLIIPGLNESTVKLPTSIMLEISDALKAQLAKNETLALPAESKTPEVEKLAGQPVTVTPESVSRSTKPTLSSALDTAETALVLSEKTSETARSVLIPEFELPLSTLAPKRFPEFPEAKTAFPLEKPRGSWASSEEPWVVPGAKTSEDSRVVQPQTATYDVISSSTTSDETEIEIHTATRDPILDSVPPKTSRTAEQPRATLAPIEALFESRNVEIFTSPEVRPTTAAPQQTTSIPSTPKRQSTPKPPRVKPAPRQTTSMPPKLKTPHSRMPAKEPVPKEPLHTTSKPKMPPSPEVADTTSVPKDERLSLKPDPEVTHSETAPLETRGIPLIPVISPRPSQEELQTAMEETDQSTQELFTTKIPRTTELAKTTQAPHRLHTAPVRPRIPGRPHGRPALNKTTTRPDKTKPRGTSHKNGVGTGTKQAPKPPSPGRNASVDSHATRKPGSVSGTRRPPIPHRHSSTRPVSPERRPLPPNNVTGKPGRAGIVSSSRVTSPPLKATLHPIGTATARPGAEQKEPTAPASEEEFGTTTDFSSSPTKETDPLGKPRFIGPHVRYIPKPENKPCSITDSVRRFPTEEATEGNATSPPQNPPTNLTVVTVEGCPSFVILDWEKPLNDTVTEYEVISRENGSFSGKNKSIQITNQTFSTVENLKPDTSYEFQVKPKNPLGEGPASNTVAFSTESADPRVSEPISAGRDAIWTERPFNSDSYSECKGKQYVKRTWYKKFVGVQLCNSLRYKIYLSDSLTGKFYNIGDQRGHGEDHCQFVDSFLDGRTGQQLTSEQLPTKEGYFRAVRQEPVQFGEIGGHTQINYVQWYECGTTIPGKW
ncbi:target of Nesh-SH3 isoform 4 precursor [Mus musculus]|uniref:ABI family member 3 binding protein n=1 Tax=Mus musculus TaxID=10090 RepID=Q59IW7_MOUSE|nr:target of Nesh-SH3 isoform 4 precursor [Mus musculus]BAD91390.1 target of Nesh-SH3 variant 4 [Mus musculus]|eukprot:NP_001014422.1 target of Nesh-SH3 isoform 4 precursor [Mus musculus]